MTPIGPVTYYHFANTRSSFHCIAKRYIQNLEQRDIEVVEHDMSEPGGLLPKRRTKIAIICPLFWIGLNGQFERIVQHMREYHEVLIGMEIADTTLISTRFSCYANHPSLAGIALPSEFSINAFRRSGVTARLGYVPYGVTALPPSARFAFLNADKRPKILVFAVNSDAWRKGLDLVSRLFSRFTDCLFVLKTLQKCSSLEELESQVARVMKLAGATAPLAEARDILRHTNIMTVSDWLSDADLASLYCNCDLLLSLHRGGSFELNCLEAAAYGLPIITPNYGCVLEYLAEDNACFVDIEKVAPLYPESARSDQCGMGATASLLDTEGKLRGLLADLPVVQTRAMQCRNSMRSTWSWKRATERLVQFIDQCVTSG